MRRACAVALFICVVATPAASVSQDAPIYYGGGIPPTLQKGGQPIGLARSGSSVTGLVALTIGCRHFDVPETIVGFKGTVTGAGFSAQGGSRVVKGLRVRVALSGTFTGDVADGTMKVKLVRARSGPRGCLPPTRTHMTLHRQAAPAGAPAQPAGGTTMRGVTDQQSKGVQMPVTLVVTGDGKRVIGLWIAMAPCAGIDFAMPVANYSPATVIGADGTFSRSESYKIPYGDGTTDRYRVGFKGQFLADGVVGTVSGRVTTVDKRGHTLGVCDSGDRHFSAVP